MSSNYPTDAHVGAGSGSGNGNGNGNGHGFDLLRRATQKMMYRYDSFALHLSVIRRDHSQIRIQVHVTTSAVREHGAGFLLLL